MQNIKLKGAKNARDFGGIVNKEGRAIKPHCFIRSNALADLSKKDIDILKNEYGLKTIIDLRTVTEIDEKPDITIDGVSYYNIPIFDEATAGITHEESIDKKQMLAHLPDLSELYKSIASQEACVSQLKKVFEIITSDDNNTILWHCTEGKDRCGIVSALFLLILDVDIDTIYEDYLFTNTASSKNAKKYYRLVRYLMRDKQAAENLKKIFSAQREFMDAFFNEINARYGSADAFICEALGITDDIKDKMKSKYLA